MSPWRLLIFAGASYNNEKTAEWPQLFFTVFDRVTLLLRMLRINISEPGRYVGST